MTIMFITGLSGVGKSSVLELLSKRGYNVIDTDYEFTTNYRSEEMLWNEDKINQLLYENRNKLLILSGCYSNQGKFYQYFDHIVLLTADIDVMLERLNKRTTNFYGKSEKDKVEIIDSYITIFPLLKKRADKIIDTTNISIEQVCDQLENILKY